jgi:hypothetical protein
LFMTRSADLMPDQKIDRRAFLVVASAAAMSLTTRSLVAAVPARIFVSPHGEDNALGSFEYPVRSIERALALSREKRRNDRATPAVVFLRGGTYELERPLQLAADDSNITIAAYEHEDAVLSGGTRLEVKWQLYRDGIFQTSVPEGTTTDQLFINGQRQVLARYPNYDPSARYLNGTAADAISSQRAARWSDPRGGYIHALQQSMWGSLHYRITGKDAGNSLQYEGGWQIDRDQPMHKSYRFVENIFEELDAPGEWFLNEKTSVLYFYPPIDVDLASAKVEVVRLQNLLQCGSENGERVRGVRLRGLIFRHTLRTFMQTREPLLRSDWRIFRGGALFLEGAEDVAIEDCFFDQVGGNAIFLSGYNRHVSISGCRIEQAGASGICFAGRPEAVRNALSSYGQRLSSAELDMTVGPRTDAYPKDCVVDDCLIVATGRVEKQTAPIEIAMSQAITVRYCSLYGVPRAGINIGDGCWGGHLIEHCDVFDTVLETSDHGAFNSWGRDRWWGVKDADADTLVHGQLKSLPTLDAMLPNTLLHTRWVCEHGWDIDLDDGSSNYRILSNLCLCGGIKLREGFYRVCENNVMVRNTLHPHVWPADSEDIIRRNIVFLPYLPIRPKAWGKEIDYNLLHIPGMSKPVPAVPLQNLSGQDKHSLMGDGHFMNVEAGDFRVQAGSPALDLGFQNFSMHSFGVRSAKLRALARTPDLARLTGARPATVGASRTPDEAQWMECTVRNLVGLAEVSAFGAPGETGVILETVPVNSVARHSGLMLNDLLLEADGVSTATTVDLLRQSARWHTGQSIQLSVLRHQAIHALTLVVP